MMKALPVILLLLSLGLGACGQTVLFDGPYPIPAEQKVKVRVDQALAGLWEVSLLWGGLRWGEYDVGGALLHVLEDDPNASVSIQYQFSDLQTEVRSVYPTWQVFQTDYRLRVLVRRREGITIVDAVGVARSTSDEVEASKKAIENAAIDLARQLAGLDGFSRWSFNR